MTLPFADKPEASRVYQDLKTKVLQNLTADEFDQLKGSMFAEGVNGLEDEYRRLLLLGLASDKISLSGPIPGTELIVSADLSPNTYGEFLTPAEGEVWQIMGASVAGFTGLTGTAVFEVDIYDVNSGNRLQIVDSSTSSSTDQPLIETGFPGQFVMHGFKARVRVEGSFTQAVDVSMGFVRVR